MTQSPRWVSSRITTWMGFAARRTPSAPELLLCHAAHRAVVLAACAAVLGAALAVPVPAGGALAHAATGAPAGTAEVPPVVVRWTGADESDADVGHILARLRRETGLALRASDFVLSEDRVLAYNHYRRYDQLEQGIRVNGRGMRVWSDKISGRLVQMEAYLWPAPPAGELEAASLPLAESAVMALAWQAVSTSADRLVRGAAVQREWDQGRDTYRVVMKARRGQHVLRFDALSGELLRQKYTAFPNADIGGDPTSGELSVPALVYPVYEEYAGERLPRVAAELKYIQRQVRRPLTDPFGLLRSRRYFYKRVDPIRGETPAGQAEGYWSPAWLARQVNSVQAALPLRPNDFATGGVLLQGRYATVNIFSEAFTAFPGVALAPEVSPQVQYVWKEVAADEDYEIIPHAASLGRTLDASDAALRREVVRDPAHNPAVYINAGFDEVQVYYAINRLFDELRPMGFVDPDLGDRPFHAFLFDPDIEVKDNAYYTDDTINFSTYSPAGLNYARDNTTIWHELGHGVMERLMGTQLALADTGGLSEGMADFVAELVLQSATGGVDFPGRAQQRIRNGIGFYLTNEVHDDGEAYGGAMKNILDRAMAAFGRAGVGMVGDLVLEAMRLSRDHPALTADVWFDRLLFADDLGREGVRAAGALRPMIQAALRARNFVPVGKQATLKLSYQGVPVDAEAPGSRGQEIVSVLAPNDKATHTVHVQVADGADFGFEWPVEVRVYFHPGALQGAVRWDGEDQEPMTFTVDRDQADLDIPLTVSGTCDEINRNDCSCSDYAYIQVWNRGAAEPIAKKRFYINVRNPDVVCPGADPGAVAGKVAG